MFCNVNIFFTKKQLFPYGIAVFLNNIDKLSGLVQHATSLAYGLQIFAQKNEKVRILPQQVLLAGGVFLLFKYFCKW